jgi:hypothetical protein
MTPEDMRRILNQLDLPTRKEEAKALGIKERQLRNYLNGTTKISKTMENLLQFYRRYVIRKKERG